MLRRTVYLLSFLPVLAFAQADQDAKIVIVPYPSADGGVAQPPPAPEPEPQHTAPPPPSDVPPPVLEAPIPQPEAPPADAPRERTLEASPPLPPPAETDKLPDGTPAPEQGPSVMIDGKPRTGAFLSGPGSLTFIMHHTLMTGFGMLGTQMIPRAIDSANARAAGVAADMAALRWTDENARIAYLAGTLIGAGLGFTGASVWQFFHWIGMSTATFGMVNSVFGALLFGGFTHLVTNGVVTGTPQEIDRAYGVGWMTLLGSLTGAWLTAIVGGGDLAVNKGLLITTGGVWAGLYTALILGIIGSLGGLSSGTGAMQALMITPALGAAAMALATLKFNPSVNQILRANLFGFAVGAGVLLLSGLVLGANFGRNGVGAVPYILGMVGAIGAKTIISLLWVEAAEQQPAVPAPAGAPAQSTKAALEKVLW